MSLVEVLCFKFLDLMHSSFDTRTNLSPDLQLTSSASSEDKNFFGLCFIQYYDVLGDEKLQVEKIDEELNYLLVQCQTCVREPGSLFQQDSMV